MKMNCEVSLESCLPGRVHFLGRRNDMPLLLNELTLLVHPARQEPLGRISEAAACGVAVVATDVGGGQRDFPAQAEAAGLCPPDDTARLASAIFELLGNCPLRESAGHCRATMRRGAVRYSEDRQRVAPTLQDAVDLQHA